MAEVERILNESRADLETKDKHGNTPLTTMHSGAMMHAPTTCVQCPVRAQPFRVVKW